MTTKIMDCPPGWEIVSFGDLGSFFKGKGIKRSDVRRSGIPCIRYGELYTRFDDYTSSTCSFVAPEVAATALPLAYGDLLFAGSGETRDEIGMCAAFVGNVPTVAGGDVIVMRGSGFNPIFLGTLANSPMVSRQKARAGQGDAVVHIYANALAAIDVWLPSLAEQDAIAGTIVAVDDLIASLERMIAKKQAIKQGMMQQLLTGKTRLPGFSAAWSTKTLGSLGTFLKGRGIKRDDVRRAGVRCIRYGELYTAFDDYTFDTRSFVSLDVAATALPLHEGDILFAGSGETREEIGKCVAYVGFEPAVAGGDVIVLRGDGFNSTYLALLCNTAPVAAQKARAGQGDAVVHIYGRALAEISVGLPPRPEQDAIAEVIVDVDREIGLLRSRLSKTRDIKHGMMQELLTGRTRLPIEEGAA